MEELSVRRITEPTEIDKLTEWMYAWWGEREGYTREAVKDSLLHSLNRDRLPMTFGLYRKGMLIGMFQFTNSDLFVRPDLTPWLANVYLDPAFRGKGFGRYMLSTVKDRAKAHLRAGELFLFTKHIGLYEKFGWIFREEIDTHLEPRIQRLYRLPLSDGGDHGGKER
ncbi:MAG: GNAT family N-acetyltransferase [Clostridia bacterium]|nr:GNAT family N-acetyltransferase [Clostridia bacterium]